MQPYTVGGPWGRLLDAETERLGEADVQAFETEGLIGSGAAPAVLSYLFHRIEDRFDGRPTLLIVDEGWLALDDPGFAGQLREWLKTLRKKNASVIFATQSLADIDGSAIAPAIIESCPTRLFLPNERALEPQIAAIYRRFGLNDRQIEILSRATPKRDYYCQSRRGNRLFELGLSEVALAFTAASSKTDQAAIAETARRARPRWLRRRLAAPQGPRLGGRHAHHHRGDFRHDRSSPSHAARRRRRRCSSLAVSSVPARAQMTVFDPSNYAQNVLTAARDAAAGQQRNPEPAEPGDVPHQPGAQSGEPALFRRWRSFSSRSARPSSSSPRRSASPTTSARSTRPSRRTYPQSYAAATSSQQLLADAQTRWQNSLAGFQDAMRVQAGVVQNLDRTRTQIERLVSSSQSATGALQAAQSGNQLVALQTKQLADLTAVMASIARAQSLEGARTVASQAQAREQLQRFLDYGPGYQPGPRRCSTEHRNQVAGHGRHGRHRPFLGIFTQYIDSGFGLIQGDVRWLAGVLIAIDITLAGLFWAISPDEDVLARLIKKTLYIGVFAFIIGNYNNLAADHLQLLRRPRAEGRRRHDQCRPAPSARDGSLRSASMPASRSSIPSPD